MEDESTCQTAQTRDEGEAGKVVLALDWIFPVEQRSTTPLIEARYVIGRSAGCDIRIDSPSISREHAEIYRQGPIFAVKDLQSKNGVYLEGMATQHAPLRAGQVLRLGDRVALLINVAKGTGERFGRARELASGVLGGGTLAKVLEPLQRASASNLAIVLEGETGTGKELLARSIHAWSQRQGDFLAVNCAALPAAMAEAELFGYRKGAFTGADRVHDGHFRAADRGTLFLDEVSELSLELQAKLLRVIQEREVLPLGASKPIPIDVRVIAACQHSLRKASVDGKFRADLHARLDGYTCLVPPLRARREDVPALFHAFVNRHWSGGAPRIEAKLIERLCLYAWPQNVREIEQLAHRMSALHGHEWVLERRFLPAHIRSEEAGFVRHADEAEIRHEDRGAYELRLLANALRRSDGNLTKAAASVGLSRRRAYRLLAGRTVTALLQEISEELVVPRAG